MWESDGPVLILAPGGQDTVTATTLQDAGVTVLLSPDLRALVLGLDHGACAVITEEILLDSNTRVLTDWMAEQPLWSDFPFVLLTRRDHSPNAEVARVLDNFVAVERPFHPQTLVSAVKFAARARRRQHEDRRHLEERSRVQERQTLLIRELHHRVRNTLANVQALLGASARSANSVEEFYRSFSNRIASLARTHNLLTEDYWQTASLHEMVRNELRPYDGMGQRVVLSGPPVELAAELAVPTSMALHELATNAMQFGALSAPEGQISVEWDVVQSEGKRKLHLTWIEQGGPPVEQPTRCGFGMMLLQRILTIQCEAEVSLEFERAGVRFEMRAPLIERRLVPPY